MKHFVGIGMMALVGLQAYGQDAKVEPAKPVAPAAVAAVTPEAPAPTSKTAIRLRLDGVGESVKTTYGTADATGASIKPPADSNAFISGIRIAPKSDITFTNKLGAATVQLRINPTFNAWTSEDAAVATTTNGAIAQIIDQFWIEQPLFTDALKLKVGKLDYPLYSGVERIVATSYDYYIKSYFSNTYVVSDPVGASLAYNMCKSKFELQLSNGIPSSTKLINPANTKGNPYVSTAAVASASSVSTGLVNQNFTTNGGWATALGYFGDFGWVKPVITYSKVQYALNDNHVLSAITDASGNAQTNYYDGKGMNIASIGGTFYVAGASIMAEYDNLVADSYKYDYKTPTVGNVAGTKIAGATPKITLNTIVLDARYPIGAWTPFLKLTSDTQKAGSVKDIEQTGMSLGVWYALTPTGRLDFDVNNTVQTQQAGSYAYGNGEKITKTTTDYILGASLSI